MAAFDLSNACLIFVLDAGYLRGFRTLVTSLDRSPRLTDVPIVVLSDDPAVLDDDAVDGRADVRYLIEPEFLSRYRDLPRDVVPERLQRELVPKYTWLKFALYRDFGFDSHIFMDADMLLFQSIDDVLSDLETKSFDFAAAPNIERSIWQGVDDPAVFRERFDAFLAACRPGEVRRFTPNTAFSFNSGIAIIQRSLLTEEHMERLFARAAEGGTQYEQRLNFFALREIEAEVCELPIWCNITRPIYDLAVCFGFDDIAEQVRVHHYIFQKPWDRPEPKLEPSDRRWLDEERREVPL